VQTRQKRELWLDGIEQLRWQVLLTIPTIPSMQRSIPHLPMMTSSSASPWDLSIWKSPPLPSLRVPFSYRPPSPYRYLNRSLLGLTLDLMWAVVSREREFQPSLFVILISLPLSLSLSISPLQDVLQSPPLLSHLPQFLPFPLQRAFQPFLKHTLFDPLQRH